MDYKSLRKDVEKFLIDHNAFEVSDVDWIFVEILKKSRSMLSFVREVSDDEAKAIWRAVQKRAEHIPIDYIFKKSNFFGRDFKVNPNVLIPRADTELLIEKVIENIKNSKLNNSDLSKLKFSNTDKDQNQININARKANQEQVKNNSTEKVKSINFNVKPLILDIGTGSGAIAITLSLEVDAEVFAVDISEKALAVAKTNAKNLGAKVRFFKSNIFSALKDIKFDYIISNPPYIKSDVIEQLDEEVKNFEPKIALDGGKDGLEFYRKIISGAGQYLKTGGKLFFEIGYDQAESVSKLLSADFENIEIFKDYGGNDRVVSAVWRGLND